MRIAVTGASGFLGGAVARALAAQGHTVFAYGRRQAHELQQPILNYEPWDLMGGPVSVPDVETVVHCAAKVGDWGIDAGYRRVNVEGTQVALKTFARAERFVHVSSASVYSTGCSNQSLTEDASVGHGLYTAYARSKAEAEQVVRASHPAAIILRPQLVYGPGDTTLMPRVLAARFLGCLLVPGNGRNRISITHIANFIHAVECVIALPAKSGTYNIADREPASVDEVLRTLLQHHGVGTRLLYTPRPIAWAAASALERVWQLARRRRAPRLTRYVVAKLADEHSLDLTRAYHLLSYVPRYSFRDRSMREEEG